MKKDSIFDCMIVCSGGKVKKGSEIIQAEDKRKMSLYERTKAQVYATGNKWAIENFHATHD